jgi:hypothetical protein
MGGVEEESGGEAAMANDVGFTQRLPGCSWAGMYGKYFHVHAYLRKPR